MVPRSGLPSFYEASGVAYKSPTNNLVKNKSSRKVSKNATSYYSNVMASNDRYESSKSIDKSFG
jgi:hypothetical protein